MLSEGTYHLLVYRLKLMIAKSFQFSLQARMLNKMTLKLTLLVVRGVDPSDGQNIHRKVLLTQLFRVAVLKKGELFSQCLVESRLYQDSSRILLVFSSFCVFSFLS
jgi:hypothetical protein